MRHFVFAFLSGFAFSAIAQTPKWDSVAVFHRPKRVLVQINEPGAVSRLQSLMTLLKAEEEILIFSADKSFKIDCDRNDRAAMCILRMLPSDKIEITGRTAIAKFALSDLQLDASAFGSEPFEISFLNSNGDNVKITVIDGILEIIAAKKPSIRFKQPR